VEYNKAINDLNFRKGTLLQTNSIYLAEGQWNPEAYLGAHQRAEAMTYALDNNHLETIPQEVVAGPGPNSWESLGNPNRPHVPGVVDGLAPAPGAFQDVPPVPQGLPAEPVEPQNATPLDSPNNQPKTAPPEKPQKIFEATQFGSEAIDSINDAVGDTIRRVGFPSINRPALKNSAAGKARL
jgi:hypothetical protein